MEKIPVKLLQVSVPTPESAQNIRLRSYWAGGRTIRSVGLSIPVLSLFLIMTFTFTSCLNKEERKLAKFLSVFEQGMDYYRKRDYQKAFECFDKCIELDSTCVECYTNRGSMKGYLHDMEGSKKDFEKALSLDSCARLSLLGLGAIYDEYKDYQQAACYYEKLIACDSTYFPVYLNYGISSYEAGDYRNTLIQLFKYLEYIQEDPDPYDYIGRIFQDNGDSVTGRKFLNKAEDIRKQEDYIGKDSMKSIIIADPTTFSNEMIND